MFAEKTDNRVPKHDKAAVHVQEKLIKNVTALVNAVDEKSVAWGYSDSSYW